MSKKNPKMADVDVNEELLDYEDEPETEVADGDNAGDAAATKSEKVKGNYVSIHSSGFRDFLLKPEVLRAIGDCGFEHPSEVQHECIPQAVLGMDVLCQGKAGMGKTAVFVLATLQQIEPVDGQVSVLGMCHTRELAFQISKEYERFSKFMTAIKVGVFFGGMAIAKDEQVLKNNCPHIIVGTPGRILALVKSKKLSLKNLKHFVLDECDKMLEQLDMRRDVQEIFRATPHEKQVMMFSATLSKDIRPVCKKFMQDPMEVYIDDEAKLTLHGLRQHYVKLKDSEKNRKLFELLDVLEFNQVVIFVKSVQRCVALAQLLIEQNFPVIAIHRGMTQEERLSRYQQFKDSRREFWWPRICSVAAWISRGSTSCSTTTCPRTRTPTCTEWRGRAGSAPRVWPSPSSATRETPRSSTRSRTGSSWTSPSCRTRSTSAATSRVGRREDKHFE